MGKLGFGISRLGSQPWALKRCVIALGSNLGDRLANLRAARDRLRALAGPGGGFVQAPVYQTEPVGCPPGSPAFLNTVVAMQFGGTAGELHAASRRIELELGRPAQCPRNAPRPIDLDLLVVGEEVLATGELTIPHPRLTGRRFVLQPLANILPELVLPGDSLTIAEHLARLPAGEPALVLVAAEW